MNWNGERLFAHADWVGEDFGAVAFIRLQLLPYDRELWICNLEIHPFYRGRSWGATIVAAAEAAAEAQGVGVIRLYPRSTSLGFWRRLGFQPATATRQWLKRIEDAPRR